MKIILAIGNTQVEDALITSLPEKCKVIGIAPYREAILTKLEEAPSTDVVLIRDNLKGSLPILSLIHNIRTNYPHCRIILMTKQREAGDPFLSEVVSFGIWDIIVGSKSSVSLMIDYILKPRTFKDVERYQIRKMISEKDEPAITKTNSQSEDTSSKSTPVSHSRKQSIPVSTDSFRLNDKKQEDVVNKSTEEEVVFNLEDVTFNLSTPVESTEEDKISNQTFTSFEQSSDMTFSETSVKKTSIPIPTPIPVPTSKKSKEKMFSKQRFTSFSDSSEFNLSESSSENLMTLESPSMESKSTPNIDSIPKTPIEPETPSFVEKPKKSMPKLFSNDDMKDIQKPKKSKIKAFQTEIKNSPIVMSLVGIRGGSGTTQTGLNLAISLANKKNRVLFVELNDSDIPFTYLYQLGNLSNGLETALEVVASPGLQDVSSYVSRMKDLKRSNDKGLANIASKYPDTLDFLAFSQFFDRETTTDYHPESLKELLMGLLLSEGYQYIILDVNLRSDKRLIEQALSSSRYIVPVVTQNVLTIGQTIDYLTKIHSNLFDLNQKVYLLINRYNHDLLKERSILKWMNNELPFKIQNVWAIPSDFKAYQIADDKSYPVLINGAPRNLVLSFETIHNYLKTM